MSKLRPIAIYLPQFHPIPENDEWWGKGFTEWTNVAKARPRFEGHYQPHLPKDLGFYDLRVHQTQIAQAALAKQYGISGFCYYHYWFNGKTLLERPLEQLLNFKTPDLPFCICWANENWTRRWDGNDDMILLKQEYSEEDDKAHINYLKKYFIDPRYIRVDGKPVFIIYRPSLFPDVKKTAEIWREECKKNGVGEIYLCYMQSFKNYVDPTTIGFDAAIEFQPDFYKFPEKIDHKRFNKRSLTPADRIFSYDEILKKMLEQEPTAYKRFPGIFPMWDNAPRKENGAGIVIDSSPEKYGQWLKKIVERFKPYSSDENFIFINAWNEWAEGNHLEPCMQWGSAYLEETKKILTDIR